MGPADPEAKLSAPLADTQPLRQGWGNPAKQSSEPEASLGSDEDRKFLGSPNEDRKFLGSPRRSYAIPRKS